MFNLEQSIAKWRKQMLTAGIELSALNELESHLREEIENQIRSGISPQLAFGMSAKSIGRGVELKKEFKKAGEPLDTRLVKLMGISCGAIALTFCLWIFSFALLDTAGLAIKATGLLAVGTIFAAWKYNYKFLPVIPNQSIRAMIGFACCIASVIMIQLFIRYVLTDMLAHPPRVNMPDGRALVLFQWAWTAMAVLSGIGYGLEKAARKREIANL